MPPWLAERHQERYRKILTREMTLAEALEENEADWKRAHEELASALEDLAAVLSEFIVPADTKQTV